VKATVRLFLFAAIVAHLLLPVGVLALQLSNATEPIDGELITIAYLSADEPAHEVERSFTKLAAAVIKSFRQAKRNGLSVDGPVTIFLLADMQFPAADLWRVCDIEPDAAVLSAFSIALPGINSCEDQAALQAYRRSFFSTYPFLKGLPEPTWTMSSGGWGEEPTKTVVPVSQETFSAYSSKLESSLERPIAEAPSLYSVIKGHGYHAGYGIVCCFLDGKEALHRFRNIVVHEAGHHLFRGLLSEVAAKIPESAGLTRRQLTALCFAHFESLNELFADWHAVSSGYNIVVSLHDMAKVPDDVKRYFSKERTLAAFVRDAKGGKFGAHYLEENHNILNPIRSLLWKCKLDLDTQTTTVLFIEACRIYLREFFQEALGSYKRVEADDGRFSLVDYPRDVRAVNLRVLSALEQAAESCLDESQRGVFASWVEKIFGSDR